MCIYFFLKYIYINIQLYYQLDTINSLDSKSENNSSQSITPIKKNNSIGDQSSIGSDTQVVVVNRTNTKFVPFEVSSTSETDVASSGTSQNLSALWTG